MVTCQPWEVACGVREAIVGLVVPLVLPIVAFLALLFIVPRLGKAGPILAILGIVALLVYYGFLSPWRIF